VTCRYSVDGRESCTGLVLVRRGFLDWGGGVVDARRGGGDSEEVVVSQGDSLRFVMVTIRQDGGLDDVLLQSPRSRYALSW
jgi:hypothetical protein